MCASALAQRSLRHRSLRSHKPPSSSSDRRRPESMSCRTFSCSSEGSKALATRHRCNSTSWSARSSCLIVLLIPGRWPVLHRSSDAARARIATAAYRAALTSSCQRAAQTAHPCAAKDTTSSGTSPCANKITASAKSPSSGSPVRENATAPAFVEARDRARATAGRQKCVRSAASRYHRRASQWRIAQPPKPHDDAPADDCQSQEVLIRLRGNRARRRSQRRSGSQRSKTRFNTELRDPPPRPRVFPGRAIMAMTIPANSRAAAAKAAPWSPLSSATW